MKNYLTYMFLASFAFGCQISPPEQGAVGVTETESDTAVDENPYAQDDLFTDFGQSPVIPFGTTDQPTDGSTGADVTDSGSQSDSNVDAIIASINGTPTGIDPFGSNTTGSGATTIDTANLTCAEQGKLTDPSNTGLCFGARAPDEFQSLSGAAALFAQRNVAGIDAAINGLSGNPQFAEVGLTTSDTPTALSSLQAFGENKLIVIIKVDSGFQFFTEE